LKLTEGERAERLRVKYAALQDEVNQRTEGSRLWNLANRCIYGTDANNRMARTSKMNMIMHGDGHGGVHHHNGFINVNGIFEGRFSIVLTNPPFGSNVEQSDVILDRDLPSPKVYEGYKEIYGKPYVEAQARLRAVAAHPKDKRIASLFTLPKGEKSKIKTEILFIERCLSLLKPGGRMGIVLPEGIFNNPSLAYVREFCEDHGYLRAVVSLPQETFYSSGASVKASLLFMDKFTADEQALFDATKQAAVDEIEAKYFPEMEAERARLQALIEAATKAHDAEGRKLRRGELAEYVKRTTALKKVEARALLKERFNYPVFLYEAEKVGITATGEPDQNELYPNEDMPPGIAKTCLELYREFRLDAEPFFALGPANDAPARGFGRAFAAWFKDLSRWVFPSRTLSAYQLPEGWSIARVGDLVKQVSERIKVEAEQDYKMAGVRWYGQGTFHRETVRGEQLSATYVTPVVPNAFIYNRLFAWKESFDVVSEEFADCFVSSEFPQFIVNEQRLLPRYLYLFFLCRSTIEAVNALSIGSSAVSRNRFKEGFFLDIEIPLPPLSVQQAIVARWQQAQEAVNGAKLALQQVTDNLNQRLMSEYTAHSIEDVFEKRSLVSSFAELLRWDVKTARAAAFRHAYPSFKPLGEYAEDATVMVKPWKEPEKQWPVYGVNNKGGVFFNYHQAGKEFNAPYKRIQKDWFFHNPTRSSVGSLGIVSDVPDDAITSPEYQVWRIKQGMIPGYVAVLINTPFFIKLIQFHRVGAVKQRLYVENLLEICVPVLSQEEQQQIAADRKAALKQITQAEESAIVAKAEVEAFILGTKTL
jgi:restriction endonuclease S subunit